jgi:glycerol-3-phosphate dehydrogenase (NAD(P)+)
MPERLGIAGDGQMALVLAAVAAEAGHEVSLWCPLPGQAGPLAASRRSPRLPEIALPASVRVGEEAAVLRESTLLLSAIPAQFARDAWRRLAAIAGPRTPVCTVTKGVEVGSGLRPTQVLTAVLGERDTAVLSGPTIAHELALRRPAVMVAASESGELAARVQGTFTQPWLRIYTSPDPAGVEIAGAAKNVIALAAGMLDGLGLGFNAKSALLARGLAELVRLGVAQGARADTLFGVAGVGDLATTCFCPEGRNRTLGEAIGKGGSLEQAQQATQSVVEGVETARALHELARARGISVPIIDAVHRVLFQGQPPAEAVRDLMTRAAGSERIG